MGFTLGPQTGRPRGPCPSVRNPLENNRPFGEPWFRPRARIQTKNHRAPRMRIPKYGNSSKNRSPRRVLYLPLWEIIPPSGPLQNVLPPSRFQLIDFFHRPPFWGVHFFWGPRSSLPRDLGISEASSSGAVHCQGG